MTPPPTACQPAAPDAVPSRQSPLYLAAVFAMVFLTCSVWRGGHGILRDSDTGAHIYCGQVLLSTGHFDDVANATWGLKAYRWTQSWLTQIGMVGVHRVFGLDGITLLFSALIAAVFSGVAREAVLRGARPETAAAFSVLAAGASLFHFTARPHVMSWFGALLFLAILRRYEKDGNDRTIWFVPPLMLLWVNLHSGWFVGVLMIGAHLGFSFLEFAYAKDPDSRARAGRRLRTLLPVMALSLACACANPKGVSILNFVKETTTEQAWISQVTEYVSPDFHSRDMAMLLLFLCSCFAAFILGDRKVSGGDALIACGLLAMGLYAVRAAAVFAVTVAPIAAARCPYPFRPTALPADNRRTAWAVVAVSLAAGVLATAAGLATRGYNEKIHPVGAYRFVQAEEMQGRMFCDPQYGHYFNYMGRGSVSLFIDGRLNAFGPERFRDMCIAWWAMRGWQDVLENHRIDFVLVPNQTPLAKELAVREKEWPRVYSDNTTTVFIRQGRYPEVLRKHPGVVFRGRISALGAREAGA